MAQPKTSIDDYDKVLVIGINHSYAGFFSYVNFTLNQLQYGEAHGHFPVVHFGKYSMDGPNAFYDPDHGENTWDYYFEPVAGLTYADLEAMIADPKHRLTDDDLVRLTGEELWRLHDDEPESIYPYPHGCYYDKIVYDIDWYMQQRHKAHALIRKYVRVKPHILAKVDAFTEENFKGERVLGLHLRGTDKGAAASPPQLMRVVKPESYYRYIDDYTEKNGPCKIFVATDQQQFLETLRSRYHERILSYEAIRTRGFTSSFQQRAGNNYRKGEDVLIDCLLLSKCDFLLKCTSAVGEFAMYFNPELQCLDLNYLTAPGPIKSKIDVTLRGAVRFVGGQGLVRRWRKLLLLLRGHKIR